MSTKLRKAWIEKNQARATYGYGSPEHVAAQRKYSKLLMKEQ